MLITCTSHVCHMYITCYSHACSVRIDHLEQGLAKKVKELEALSHFRANYDQISERLQEQHMIMTCSSLPLFLSFL